MYSIELSRQAARFLKRLDIALRKRIEQRLKRLRDEPVPSDAKFLGRHKGEKVYRYRIGAYRVLYKVKQSSKLILVAKLDKRSRAYQ